MRRSTSALVALAPGTATTGALCLWLVLAVTGCPDPSLVPCGDVLCPREATCVAGELCATQDQIRACVDIADGMTCPIGGGVGRCDRGVCVATGCGNDVVDPGEACDDGNATSGDGCRADCAKIERCGDAVLDTGEGCDDANENASDGCDACMPASWLAAPAIGGTITATSIGLTFPRGIATDAYGNVYVADQYAHRVRRFDATGFATVVAGDGVQGDTGDGGPANAARLALPADVAVDSLGNVYIADAASHRVRRVDLTGQITTIAGTGAYGFSGDGGPATVAQLDGPSAVAVDGLGNVFIADRQNARIRRVDALGTITTIAGTGIADYNGDDGPAIEAAIRPVDLAIDAAGYLYFADDSYRVRRIDPAGIVRTFAGTGIPGDGGDDGPATQAMLLRPSSVAIDALGRLLIGDRGRVRRVDGTGTITRIAGTTLGFSGDGGPAIDAQIGVGSEGIPAVAAAASGQIYLVDYASQRIRRIDTAGIITTFAGHGGHGTDVEGGLATGATLLWPSTVAVDAAGAVYIAEPARSRVRRVDPTGLITTVAGSGIRGSSGDGGPATSARLDYPVGLAIAGNGDLYIADADAHRIRRVDTTGTITTVAGTGVMGAAGDGGPAALAQLGSPRALAIDGTDRLLVAEGYNCTVRVIDANGTISTIGGVAGVCGFNGDGPLATQAQLQIPNDVAVDSAGNVYVADTVNRAIRKITPSGSIITIAGRGADETGEDIVATDAALWEPMGVAVDTSGAVYASDKGRQCVRKIVDGRIRTLTGTALQAGAGGDGGPAAFGLLNHPAGLDFDPSGRLFIADTDNGRIRRISTAGELTTVAGLVDPEGTGLVAGGHLADPRALVVAPDFTFVAGGAHGVVEAVRGGVISVVAGRYPQVAAIGDRARYRANSFGTVSGVAYDATAGLVYLSESSNHRLHAIRIVAPNDATTWTLASLNAGTAGFRDGPLATAQFRDPQGLYLDATTRTLYVADMGNHVIRAIALSAPGQPVTTIAGIPATRGLFGDGGPAPSALLHAPRAITRCRNGDVFIADTGNHRVRRIDAATGSISTVLGDGIPASSGEGAPATSFPVHTPSGLACDATGNVFVTSTTAVRLLPAAPNGTVDGQGTVLTIYGAAPRTRFPDSVTTCLTGVAVVDEATVRVTDACSGLLVELRRERNAPR